ncbi:hypothetical protein CH63R_04092 [Colletotrichum higginsianum IMI 349063]|uniref:Phytochrome chromophore attachment site domain-containing protein n=2 Tax=Colletotrichum higginsianum TaxID=80884 RepID=A0A1B7YIB6_COLHI|nr:hypothetical protein CH63R_04092 [Colletotrichum higginsianum IMI 349063]OBR11796.1 hypothetical protein CH63R_04092 [Colletotrichum higginsianum IMI 349063]
MSGVQLPAQLEAADRIPIARLSPDVQEPKTCAVRGVVTITWPYSIVKKTIAFLLAEPDFRLRRAKGQVRVEFGGSSAKAVAEAALGSGDEITLSLEGVDFVVDEPRTHVPGMSLEWQLRFTERLLLQAKISDSEDVKVVNVDHPTQPEPDTELELPQSVSDPFIDREQTPERTVTSFTPSSKRPINESLGADEYPSPAFLKRARISYGSLFEDGVGVFDEDIGAKARAKKRTKTGRYSGVWRYTSQSPSPEPEAREVSETEDTPKIESPAIVTPSRPKMVDDGCQTIERDVSPLREVQVIAEARQSPSYWRSPSKMTMVDSAVQSDLPLSPNVELSPGLAFGQPAPIPLFTSAHEPYAPAFHQPPLSPVFGHGDEGSMEPHYDAEEPFHEHRNAYPEAGLDHVLDAHDYPVSLLEDPNTASHTAATPQTTSEPIPAYHNHQQQQSLEGEHHTVVIEGIAQPQQVPWGLTSAHYSGSSVVSGEPVFEGQQAGQPPKTRTGPRDNWVEDRGGQAKIDDENSKGEQVALEAEGGMASEDGDGLHEEPTSVSYAERHFQPTENEATADEQGSSSSSGSSSEDSEEEAEHEVDDAGGDYDITNYRNLSNNQDDDNGTDLESDYGQEAEEEMLEPGLQGNEEDEPEEAIEDYGEEYDEDEGEDDDEEEEDEGEEEDEDEDEDAENHHPPTASRGGAPEVISLLSDSEDEDEAPPPRPAPVQQRQIPQSDGSTDEVEDDDPYDREESEAKYDSHEDDHEESSESLDGESEEEVSQFDTPTPKPRPTSSGPAYDALELTSATVGDDLEAMSPIKLPQATDVSRSSSRPSSRGDSEMLAAELEEELEKELAVDNPNSEQQALQLEDPLDVRMSEVEAVPSAKVVADVNAKKQTPPYEEVNNIRDSEVQKEEPPFQPDKPVNEGRHTLEVKTDAEAEVPVAEDAGALANQDFKATVDDDQDLPSDPAAEEAEVQRTPSRSAADIDSDCQSQVEGSRSCDLVENEVDLQETPKGSDVVIAETQRSHTESDKEMQANNEGRSTPNAASNSGKVMDMHTEKAQAVEVDDQKSVKEHAPDLIETEAADTNAEETTSLKDDQDMDLEQEADVESKVEAAVATIVHDTTTIEVDMESADGDSRDPTDVDMADTEAMSVEEASDQASDMDMDEMTEEQLIQSQLQEETFMFEHQTVTNTITITQEAGERTVLHEGKTADDANPASETEIIETSRMRMETFVAKPMVNGDERFLETAPEDEMDVDELNDAKSMELASPPPTEQFQSQSLEAVKPGKQTSQASDQLNMLEGALQLVTPGGTQQIEGASQLFVETQLPEVPEANTKVSVPEIDDAPSQTQSTAPEDKTESHGQEIPENQATSFTTPVQSRETIERTLEASNEADATSPTNDESSSQVRDYSAQPSEVQSPLIAEDVSEEVNAAQPSPRRGRGHRRDRSDIARKDHDPSVKVGRASIASRRSTRLSDRTTPDSTRVTRARSQSLAVRSDSPDVEDDNVQLAKIALKSPSRAPRTKLPKEKEAIKHDEAKELKEKERAKSKETEGEEPPKEASEQKTPAEFKAQLTRSLRANVPDCISLKVLRGYPGKAVDVLAVATTEPPEGKRAKGGPRGIMLAFNVTDHSIAPSQTILVQIFRPHKTALPVVHPGDAILLRNFSVMTLTSRGFGLRANDGSSWAVFEHKSQDDLPQIRGPPVELTDGETSHAALLKQWYNGLDAKSLARLDKANVTAPIGN